MIKNAILAAVTTTVGAAMCLDAHAVNKCTDPKTGKVTYSDARCPDEHKQAGVKIFASPSAPAAPTPARAIEPGEAPPPPPATGADVEKRMLAKITHEKRVAELQRAISGVEYDIDFRNRQMSNELELLRTKKLYAKNNLAGATWEQSLSAEMQAVTAKYAALNNVDFERLKVLREQLAAVQQGGIR